MTQTTPTVSRPYKRRVRNLFIHKPMQREFIFVIISLLIVSSLAMGFFIHHTVQEAATGGGFFFGKISAYEVLSNVTYELLLRVILTQFITLLLLGIFSVFFLHRVAGPVYRFHKLFVRVNEGEIPNPIRLREGDFFSETAQEINRLLKRLQFEKTRRQVVREKVSQILAAHPNDSTLKPAKELNLVLDKEPDEG